MSGRRELTISTISSGQFATSICDQQRADQSTGRLDPYGKVPAVSITGVTGFSAGSAPWKERNLDRTYFDNLAYQLRQAHRSAPASRFQQMIKTENAVNGEPSFSFNSWGDFLLGNVAPLRRPCRDIIPDLHFVNSEAYIQDDWKISTSD